MFKLIIVSYIIASVICDEDVKKWKECDFNFMPMPFICTVGHLYKNLTQPCNIFYLINIQKQQNTKFKELFDHYQFILFGCSSANVFYSDQKHSEILKLSTYTIDIKIINATSENNYDILFQHYQIEANQTNAHFECLHYSGCVRAIETFSQIINFQKNKSGDIQYSLKNLPISIKDLPQYHYRGLMIDTAKHYLPYNIILETIDAMMYNKLNVLHWRISDDDSFPLLLNSHPELALNGRYSQQQYYTVNQAKQIVRYAEIRGIRVIPEIHTPGMTKSWSKSKQLWDIICVEKGKGVLDITMTKTYQILEEILREINDIFKDQYIHLGGEAIHITCQKNWTKYAELEKFNSQLPIEEVYRKKIRSIVKSINPNKKIIFWYNPNYNQNQSAEDIIQWWADKLPKVRNKLILSPPKYNLHYGQGDILGRNINSYAIWLQLFSKNIKEQISTLENRNNVMGAELILSSQTSNQYTHHINIWMRATAAAERLWNSKITNLSVLKRISAHEKLMNRRGIPTSPVTKQYCQMHSTSCTVH